MDFVPCRIKTTVDKLKERDREHLPLLLRFRMMLHLQQTWSLFCPCKDFIWFVYNSINLIMLQFTLFVGFLEHLSKRYAPCTLVFLRTFKSHQHLHVVYLAPP